MTKTHIKDGLLGMALALVAAYLFPVILFTILNWPRGALFLFRGVPFYGVTYASWIVIPLGASLGMPVPRLANGKPRWIAALQGAGFGAVAGLVTILCFTAVFRAAWGTPLRISVITYCALWVGAYALIRAKGQSIYR